VLVVKFVPCFATSRKFADVPVPVGRSAEHVYRSTPSRVPLPPSAPLGDLGPLVLGHHPLHLEEKILFRGPADRTVQEHHFDPAAAELFEQQHLVGITTSQPVGRVDVESVENTGRSLVTKSLKGRPQQSRPTVPFVEKAELGIEPQPVGPNTFPESLDLAGDGIRVGLLLRRDTGVDGCPRLWRGHQLRPPVVVVAFARTRRLFARGVGFCVRAGSDGARIWSYAAARNSSASRVASNTQEMGSGSDRLGVGGSEPSMVGALRAGSEDTHAIAHIPPGRQSDPRDGRSRARSIIVSIRALFATLWAEWWRADEPITRQRLPPTGFSAHRFPAQLRTQMRRNRTSRRTASFGLRNRRLKVRILLGVLSKPLLFQYQNATGRGVGFVSEQLGFVELSTKPIGDYPDGPPEEPHPDLRTSQSLRPRPSDLDRCHRCPPRKAPPRPVQLARVPPGQSPTGTRDLHVPL
jgi:hypothetical protein